MEQTVNFAVFKEKIIKINELFNVILEKEKLLEKSQKWGELLKNRLELSKSEITKLKSGNDSLTVDLTATRKQFVSLTEQHETLKTEFDKLETDSNTRLNNLQVNYQLANLELKECREKLHKLESKKEITETSPKKVKKKVAVKDNVDTFSTKLVELELEKDCLLSEKQDLQLEISELRKRIKEFEALENNNTECLALEKEYKELKNNYETTVQSKDKEICRLNEEVKQLKNEKKKLNLKCEKLQEEVASCKVEIALLQEKKADEENLEVVRDINAASCEEPKPNKENFETLEVFRDINDTPCDQEISAIFKEMVLPLRVSPLESIDEEREKNIPHFNYQRIIERKRKLRQRRLRIEHRRNRKHVDLYGTLVALKKANIDFVISSDSLVPTALVPKPPKYDYSYKYRKNFKVKKKNITITKELSCQLSCCQKSYMVLRKCEDGDDDTKLLGFVEVKDERKISVANTVNDNIETHIPTETSDKSVIEQQNVDITTEPPCKKRVVRKLKSPRTSFKRPVCTRRRSLRHSPVKTIPDEISAVPNEILVEKTISPKTSFKRPLCSTKRALPQSQVTTVAAETLTELDVNDSPKSPESAPSDDPSPVLIPLEKIEKSLEKMPTTKIEMLFNKLILYSADEVAMNDVVREFSSQEPEYIAEAVLERVAVDHHEAADAKYPLAPLMTDVQRTLLGFMSQLDKSSAPGVYECFLTLAEQRLLTCKVLHEFGPITRLYLGVCKQKKDIMRMRKLCCDVFYFCGDFAVPFLFTVLTSWIRVLPLETESKDSPVARVLVQLVLMKDCNTPGYNLRPLKDLLHKYYGYPTERWDENEFFTELYNNYLRNPSRLTDFPLILYCKHRPEKWVYEKIDEFFKPHVEKPIQDNFKATLIILIGTLYNRFSSKSEVNYLTKVREWMMGLINEGTPDVVKRCIYVSLHRLKNK